MHDFYEEMLLDSRVAAEDISLYHRNLLSVNMFATYMVFCNKVDAKGEGYAFVAKSQGVSVLTITRYCL